MLRRLEADPDPAVRRALARSLPQSLTVDPSVRALMIGVITADADDEVRLLVTQSLPRDLSEVEVRALLLRLPADRSIENREALLRVIAQAAGEQEAVQAELRRIASDTTQPDRMRTLARLETLRAAGAWEAAAGPSGESR